MTISHPTRYSAIDGLRGLAIISVIFGHYGLHGNGALGVVLFFVISGEVITASLITEYSRTGRANLRNFYIRRVARLVPMLILVCCLTILVLIIFNFPFKLWYLGPISMLTFTTDLVEIFLGDSHLSTYFNYNWSLGVEEQFYLIWPLVVALVFKTRQRFKLLFLITIVSTGFSLLFYYFLPNNIHFFNYRVHKLNYEFASPISFAAILFGVGVAILASSKRLLSGTKGGIRKNLQHLVEFSLVTLILLNLYGANFPFPFLRNNGRLVTASCGAFLIFLIIFGENGPVVKMLTWKPLLMIGRMSYTLYMTNLLWWNTMKRFQPKIFLNHQLTFSLLAASLLLIVNWFVYLNYEVPLQKRINKWQS
jgi:hypothetical protein